MSEEGDGPPGVPSGFHGQVDPASAALPGGVRILRAVTHIPRPRDEVFPFFADAENLERITPRELRFRIVTPTPVDMREGVTIDYRLKLGGVGFGWRTVIDEWDPPRAFTDTQLRGPYDTWVHRHLFEEVDGGTRMTDEVRWRLPLWPLSAPALPIVRAQLGRIFRYRQTAMERLLMAP